MALQPKTTVRVFDKYSLVIPAGLKWHQDGCPGKRVLCILDSEKTFHVSLEEGMKKMDMLPNAEGSPTVSYQCFQEGKYIHLKRSSGGRITHAFFHLELDDDDGSILYLAGQMVVFDCYQWSDGIEPVLMQILNGISICKT